MRFVKDENVCLALPENKIVELECVSQPFMESV